MFCLSLIFYDSVNHFSNTPEELFTNSWVASCSFWTNLAHFGNEYNIQG